VKRPAFMFYPADWRKDPALRVCSIAARGLWIDMMALMHEGEPYGHLVVNGEAVSDAQLARLIGESVAVVRRLVKELESRNVFSRTESGVIFSRRMVADEHIRTVRAESGKLGGNPALKDKGKDKQKDNQTSKQIPTPSVAVAGSVAVSSSEPSSSAAPVVVFDAVTALIERIPEASRPAWRAELASAEQGMHGPALTAGQVQTACRDYLGNENEGKRSLRHFRGYLRSIGEPRPTRPIAAPGDSGEPAWAAVLALLPGFVRREPDIGERQRALPAQTRTALSSIGGFQRIHETAPDQRPWLKKEFLAAYRVPTTEPAHV
jgi:hypothetical protein